MSTKDRLLELAATGRLSGEGIPAAFFMHFPDDAHTGAAAVRSHMAFFEQAGNDIVKVQYERHFPRIEEIASGGEWESIPVYDTEFFREPLEVVGGVVKAVDGNAPVIVTLYSAYMFAQQTVGRDALRSQLAQSPERVAVGLERIVESMGHFITGCIELGVDGFYASTQGGEAGILPDGVFERYVRPSDLAAWEYFREKCPMNVLHVCDFEGPYESIDSYSDYPGQIVSAPTHLVDGTLTGAEISALFGRPFLGGMDRLGYLSHGPTDAIRQEAAAAIAAGPDAMILGADCTLLGTTPWDNIAAATEVAHNHK
jgi:hypothetical protein